jgi:hypothetical protein
VLIHPANQSVVIGKNKKTVVLLHDWLGDSPTALCAWILEKLTNWTDCNRNIENIFTKNELLSWINLLIKFIFTPSTINPRQRNDFLLPNTIIIAILPIGKQPLKIAPVDA